MPRTRSQVPAPANVRPAEALFPQLIRTLGLLTGINNYFAGERRGTESIADNDPPT